jgi:DDE_Tnp_1-associated
LAAAFARVPDPRRPSSLTYALPALLSNHLSVLAIAQWEARQAPELLRTLGFPDGWTPCRSTLQRLFRTLDGHALSAALSTSRQLGLLAHEPLAQGAEKGEAGEAELTVAPALLARLPWPGRVLTGEARFCQRHLCQQVLDAGGD